MQKQILEAMTLHFYEPGGLFLFKAHDFLTWEVEIIFWKNISVSFWGWRSATLWQLNLKDDRF